MAENPKICVVCDQRAVSKDSTHWCPDCEQALCGECKEHHQLQKMTKQHKLITIENYLGLAESSALPQVYCQTHNERFLLFCKSHEQVLCLQCIKGHSKCPDIVTIDSLTDGKRQSDALRALDTGLTEAERDVSVLEKYTKTNLDAVDNHSSKLIDEVKEARRKINNHLDRIERQIISKIQDAKTEVKGDCSAVYNEVLERKSSLSDLRRQLNSTKKHGSDLQVLLSLLRLSSAVNDEEKQLQLFTEGGKLDKKNIVLDIDRRWTMMPNDDALGTVKVETVPHNVRLEQPKLTQAQIIQRVLTERNIDRITARYHSTLMSGNHKFTGCCIFKNSNIALIDRDNKHVVIYQRDRKRVSYVLVDQKYLPYDIACINDRAVAVSCFRHICLVDINDKIITKTINIKGGFVQGLTVYDGMIVCCVTGVGIQMIDPSDGSVRQTFAVDMTWSGSVAAYSGTLVYTNKNTGAVECINGDGGHLWTFKDRSILQRPWGISIDQNGIIYVACRDLSNVVILSADGQKGKVLLSDEDGLNDPKVLCFYKTDNRLIVSNAGQNANMFDILYRAVTRV